MKLLNYPTITTKLLSSFGLLFFLIALGLGSYLISYNKNEIDKNKFTIS